MTMTVALVLALAGAGPPQLDRVRVADDGKGFVLAASGQPFTPWGLNYGNAGRLIEDFWETDWATVAADFRDMTALGANVVRVHLQFGKFMDAADRPNPKALDRLGRLLELAAETASTSTSPASAATARPTCRSGTTGSPRTTAGRRRRSSGAPSPGGARGVRRSSATT